MNVPSIVAVTPAEVPLLLALVRELAEFEHLAHEVVATEDELRDGLFGPHANAEAVLLRVGDAVVGFALWFHNFSTFVGRRGLYLEDLYVRPDQRGKGHGAALLAHVAALAVERGCGRFEWAVLDWNRRAIDFYEAMGARPMNDWTVFRLTAAPLAALAHRARR